MQKSPDKHTTRECWVDTLLHDRIKLNLSCPRGVRVDFGSDNGIVPAASATEKTAAQLERLVLWSLASFLCLLVKQYQVDARCR